MCVSVSVVLFRLFVSRFLFSWWIFNTTYTFILKTHKIKRSKYNVWKIADCEIDVSCNVVSRICSLSSFSVHARAHAHASHSFFAFALQWMLLYVCSICLIKYYIRNCEKYPPLFSFQNAVFRALCCSH